MSPPRSSRAEALVERLPDGRIAYNPRRTFADLHAIKAAILADVREEQGIPENAPFDPKVYFEVERRWERFWNTPAPCERFAEWQKRCPIKTVRAARSLLFTTEELEHLADHFDGANDPLGQAILEKVRAEIESRNAK